MTIEFNDRVVIVTGAGGGLGREHALQFAERGAKVVVNDFGGSVSGDGGSSEPANAVVREITERGGEAFAHGADVTNREQVEDMIAKTIARWGRIDVLVNNAGILRDTTFAKMTPETFRAVVETHLMGSYNCTAAVWPHMREASYGRIVMTSSSSGVYGNFGQSNYAAAKLGVVGLMNVLHLEGVKYNIRVNSLVPAANTRMTEGLMPPPVLELMKTSAVTPMVLYLASEDAPSKTIMAAGSGGYSRIFVMESEGIYLPENERTPEAIAACADKLNDKSTLDEMDISSQSLKFLRKAAQDTGVDLGR